MKKFFISFLVILVMLLIFLFLLFMFNNMLGMRNYSKVDSNVGNDSSIQYMEDLAFEPNKDYEKADEKLVITNDNSRFYVNGQDVPDPIRVSKNTQLNVLVQNASSYDISLHFHGILGMNKMDGVGGMTQYNINPGESF